MEMNTETAAHDLIARMMLVNEHGMSKQHIKDNMDKFRSAIIFQGFMKKNLIVGSTNQELHDLYCKIALDMDIQPLSLIDFSRTLCKYYGFELYSVKKNGKTKRIFRENITPTKTDQIHAVQALTYYAINEQTKEDFLGQRNSDAYEKYVEWCRNNVQPITSNIGFSRTVSGTTKLTHTHDIEGTKQMTIHNHLEKGEEVILLRMQGGQKYIVLDRIGGD